MVPLVNRYVDRPLSGNLLNIPFPLPEKGAATKRGGRWAAMNQGRGRRKEKGLCNGEGGRGGVSPFADEEKAAASTITRQRRGGIGDVAEASPHPSGRRKRGDIASFFNF
ncbi:hypothetical protein BHM03_00007064 [Ensete ventricosum]|nr:hypothetical protein BHM03_00007064 [Ensete ventricosum]